MANALLMCVGYCVAYLPEEHDLVTERKVVRVDVLVQGLSMNEIHGEFIQPTIDVRVAIFNPLFKYLDSEELASEISDIEKI